MKIRRIPDSEIEIDDFKPENDPNDQNVISDKTMLQGFELEQGAPRASGPRALKLALPSLELGQGRGPLAGVWGRCHPLTSGL